MPPLARALVSPASCSSRWASRCGSRRRHSAGSAACPGDLRIERPNLRVYVPLTTSILVSVVLSALFWLISRLR